MTKKAFGFSKTSWFSSRLYPKIRNLLGINTQVPGIARFMCLVYISTILCPSLGFINLIGQIVLYRFFQTILFTDKVNGSMSRLPNAVKTFLSGLSRSICDEINNSVGVSEFVIVPADQLDKIVIEPNACSSIKN